MPLSRGIVLEALCLSVHRYIMYVHPKAYVFNTSLATTWISLKLSQMNDLNVKMIVMKGFLVELWPFVCFTSIEYTVA